MDQGRAPGIEPPGGHRQRFGVAIDPDNQATGGGEILDCRRMTAEPDCQVEETFSPLRGGGLHNLVQQHREMPGLFLGQIRSPRTILFERWLVT